MLNGENEMVQCTRSSLFLFTLLAQVAPTHKNPPLLLKLFCVAIACALHQAKKILFFSGSLNHFEPETSDSQGAKRKHHGSTTIAKI